MLCSMHSASCTYLLRLERDHARMERVPTCLVPDNAPVSSNDCDIGGRSWGDIQLQCFEFSRVVKYDTRSAAEFFLWFLFGFLGFGVFGFLELARGTFFGASSTRDRG